MIVLIGAVWHVAGDDNRPLCGAKGRAKRTSDASPVGPTFEGAKLCVTCGRRAR